MNPRARYITFGVIAVLAFMSIILGVYIRTAYRDDKHTVTRVNIVRNRAGSPLSVRRFALVQGSKFYIVDEPTFGRYAVPRSVVRDRRVVPPAPSVFADIDIVFDPPIPDVSQLYVHLEGGGENSACGTHIFVTYKSGLITEYMLPSWYHGRAWVFRNHRKAPLRPTHPLDAETHNPVSDSNCNI